MTRSWSKAVSRSNLRHCVPNLADGGRLVCIQGAGPAAKAVIYRRDGDDITERAVFDAAAAALPGFAKAPPSCSDPGLPNLYPETLRSAFFSGA